MGLATHTPFLGAIQAWVSIYKHLSLWSPIKLVAAPNSYCCEDREKMAIQNCENKRKNNEHKQTQPATHQDPTFFGTPFPCHQATRPPGRPSRGIDGTFSRTSRGPGGATVISWCRQGAMEQWLKPMVGLDEIWNKMGW